MVQNVNKLIVLVQKKERFIINCKKVIDQSSRWILLHNHLAYVVEIMQQTNYSQGNLEKDHSCKIDLTQIW